MNKKPVEKRIESVTKQPLLTDFASTIFATSKRRLQAQLRSTRDSLLGLHLDGYSQLFGQAAGRGERRVREMSFKATVDIILSSRSDFMAFGGQTRNLRNYRERFLEICATKTLDIRPFRSEPRAVKRRPKSYQLLTKPRPIFQEIQHRSTYRKAA